MEIQASGWCCKLEPCAITPRSFPSSLLTSHHWHTPHLVTPAKIGESLEGRFNLVGNSSPPHTFQHRAAGRATACGAWFSLLGSAQARSAPSGVGRTLTLHKAGTHHIGTQASLEAGLRAPSSRRHIPGTPRPEGRSNWTAWTLLAPLGCCFCNCCWWGPRWATELRRCQVLAGPGTPSSRRASAGVGSEGAAAVGSPAPTLSAPLSPDPCRTGRLGAAGRDGRAEVCTFSLCKTPCAGKPWDRSPREDSTFLETWLTSFPL